MEDRRLCQDCTDDYIKVCPLINKDQCYHNILLEKHRRVQTAIKVKDNPLDYPVLIVKSNVLKYMN